jgi:glucose-1-phosphate thymidylyltransferase
MYLGDNILKEGIIKHAENFRKKKFDASIMLTEVDNPEEFGVAELRADGSVKQLIEKPKKPPSNLALVGIYFFNSPIQ